MNKVKRILITTGDTDGIGFEVSAKALHKIGPKRSAQFLYFRHPNSEKRYLRLIEKKFLIKSFATLDEALDQKYDPKIILEVLNEKSPAINFQDGVQSALERNIQAIVTAPLSKELIQNSGLSDRGHTDIMRRLINQKKKIYMAFMGKLFSVMLVTDHISLREVPNKISEKDLSELFVSASEFLKMLTLPKKKQKIGVLGLNPHAGELSNMGTEEKEIISQAIKKSQDKGVPLYGPLVPDVAFQDTQFQKYGLFIAMYHDQGLIPFKMLHKNYHGVQISLNTPFIRTSVDHGTAKDIFGKNKADSNSMINAIQSALKLV